MRENIKQAKYQLTVSPAMDAVIKEIARLRGENHLSTVATEYLHIGLLHKAQEEIHLHRQFEHRWRD